jgi:hypothetical protein
MLAAKISVCHDAGGMFTAAGTILMSNEPPIMPVSLSIGLLEAPLLGWERASEELAQNLEGSGRSADKERRASVVIGDGAAAVLEVRLLAGVGAGDLIAHRAPRVLLGDRTGADDLVVRQGLIGKRG